jgi:hypothetical protein
MSTTFGIITKSGDERLVARRVGGKNGAEMWFTDELAEMLPNDTPVEPLDNSAQGIHTIGDIKNHILNQYSFSYEGDRV